MVAGEELFGLDEDGVFTVDGEPIPYVIGAEGGVVFDEDGAVAIMFMDDGKVALVNEAEEVTDNLFTHEGCTGELVPLCAYVFISVVTLHEALEAIVEEG